MRASEPIAKRLLLHFCLFLLIHLCLVPFGNTAITEQASEFTLKNGLKVILLENHKAPLITFQVWYRVGSRDEPFGKSGLSHILEHMMFKGTERIGPGEFSRIVQENGGNENAFTSHDFTGFFENMSSDRVEVPIRLESDRMQGLLLREEDFNTERAVVMEERRLRTEDNPKAILQEQLQAAAFQIQPYRRPIIGWMDDLSHLTVEDLRKHYQTYYNPANAFLVVVGDFNKEKLLPLIDRAFGSIPGGVAPGYREYKEARRYGERRIHVRREAQLATVVKAYNVPNLREPDSYVLEVIAAILSAGESSRLHRRMVREEELALSVDADHELVSRDPYIFSFAADVLPGRKVDEVEKALMDEIERLKKETVGDRELQKAKNQLEASFTFAQDSLFAQAMLLARYEIVSTWKDLDRYVPSIRRVTAEDITRVARTYFVDEQCTTGVLVPLPSAEPKMLQPGSPLKERIIR
jgi:zinc protease